MNKYDKLDSNYNRVGQINMANSNFSQNDGINYQHYSVYPGTSGLRNQQIAMPTALPAQLQSNLFPQIYFNPPSYPTQFIPTQNVFICHDQMNPQIMNNSYSQIQPNIIRPSQMAYNQGQTPIMYHPSPVDKMNQNQQSSILVPQNFSIYHHPNQTIQHPISNIQQAPIQPHIQPHHHSQIQQSQLPNQFLPTHTLRQCVPIVNDKHAKTNSALEIINPETNKTIDLTLYKTCKNNKIEHYELKIEKSDYHEIDLQQDRYPETCIIKDEYSNHKTNIPETNEAVPIELHKIQVDNREYEGENIGKFSNPEAFVDDDEPFESRQDKDNDIGPVITIQNFKRTFQNAVELDDLQDIDNNNIRPKTPETPLLIQGTVMGLNNGLLNKFIYSRDELLKIGKNALSRQKPKGLPLKEVFTDPIILDHSMNITGLENIESMHSINQRSSKVHKSSQGTPISWRHLNYKNVHGFPKYINLGNTENVLSKSDDGYVTCKQRLAAGEELSETEELIRQIKGILNRIVPQNFDQCLDDLVSLKIGTHEGMTCLVNELFLKAVKEEAYSVTFAKICSYLASIKADVSDHEIVTFRSVLLQKCQAMFTTPLEEQLENVRQEWLLKASNEKPKTKALMESDVDEQIKKAKDRYYGNIRFIGELYLKGVLITKIICFCIENLLTKDNDADSLICLCKLLETCGAKLETESKGKEKLNDSFKKLRQLSESILIETRVRFRILDIMEMRQKKWCLRKVQQEQKIQPKTLEEIKIEKEMEEEKEHYSTLNRKNTTNWTADRRPSLPNVNKSRSNFTPKQLSVTSCSHDSTTLGPQKRNWSAGSGTAIHPNTTDNEKSIRINKHKGKINPEVRPKDIVYGLENPDSLINQTIDGCVSNYANCYLQTQSFSACSYQSTNSSENSSRSSSHSRSTPQTISKEKLPDSKLVQSITLDFTLLSPIELLKEYSNSTSLCSDSWNAYSDKVEVVYQWLDSNFDTDCDTRISLSNLLAMLINKNLMKKADLLKAFSKLIDSLEDLIIDVGQTIWDSLSDYFIPFLESMETDSIDLIDSIFDFEALRKFNDKNASIIYSLPWSMINKILKCSNLVKCPDIFILALATDCMKRLSSCEQKLISIISKNLFRAIKVVTRISVDFYLNWFVLRIEESFNCFSEEFFIILNWEEMFHQIQTDPYEITEFSKCFKKISSMSKRNEILTTLRKISNNTDENCRGIFSFLRCLLKTNTCDLQTFLEWESESHTVPYPSKLKNVLTVLKNQSAFISDNSFEYLLSFDEPNYCISNSTFDHNNCTNSD